MRAMWPIRVLSVAYAVLLSFFLLTRDPTLGGQSTLLWLLKRAGGNVHFMSLLLLTVLTVVARWPVPSWITVLGLTTYAIALELLQHFVPQRTVDWVDGFQNVAGVAVGLAICRFVRFLKNRDRSSGPRR